MILPFSTELNGKPTYFIEKIWEGMPIEPMSAFSKEYLKYQKEYLDRFGQYWDGTGHMEHEPVNAKLHTIRTDKGNRWKKDCTIDFFINNRKPDMFRFAPKLPCTGTQRIFMSYFNELEISIDGRQLTHDEIDTLYKNDGFDTYEDFEEYFLLQMDVENEFLGKIIHWTDFRY